MNDRAKLDSLEQAETIAAIRRGMDDVEAGRIISLEDAAAAIRAKHGLGVAATD